jgi:hypothetical protein
MAPLCKGLAPKPPDPPAAAPAGRTGRGRAAAVGLLTALLPALWLTLAAAAAAAAAGL